MIGRISGILLEKNPPQLLVDCNGVGYEVDVPMSTYYNLPQLGEKVTLFTHQAIREDAHLLFGFGNAAERAVFRQLIKITGVGARTALSILSGMTIADLAQAVTLQEAGRLVKVPAVQHDAQSDILNALLALGYSDKEALAALKNMPSGSSVSDGIKYALKALSKG
jgi:Holliday junction DNA helicase RuvA